MESHELMRLLIPDGNVKSVARFTGLTASLLYQERRKSGEDLTDTGTRNTLDRLDMFCESALGRNPEVVRLVGERYIQMYVNYISPPTKTPSIDDLLVELGEVSRECGEAIAVLAARKSIKKCAVEVAEAKQSLEKALAMVAILDEDNQD